MGRTSSTATNCSSKLTGPKIRPYDLHNEAYLFAFLHTIMHVSQGSKIYILKLFFCLSHFASTTEGLLLEPNFSTQGMFTPIFRRLVAGRLQAVPYTHTVPEKFCQFHLVSRSSPISSVSVLCHSVTLTLSPTSAHTVPFSPTLYAGFIFHPSLATSVRSVPWRRYTVPRLLSLRISGHSYYLLLYLYYMTIICYKKQNKNVAVAVAAATAVVVHSDLPDRPAMLISAVVTARRDISEGDRY